MTRAGARDAATFVGRSEAQASLRWPVAAASGALRERHAEALQDWNVPLEVVIGKLL